MMRRYFGRPRSCRARRILSMAERIERNRRNRENLRAGPNPEPYTKDAKDAKEGGAK